MILPFQLPAHGRMNTKIMDVAIFQLQAINSISSILVDASLRYSLKSFGIAFSDLPQASSAGVY
ncbi:hypothetical protein TIFTF001_002258 [Ficus carica]|uniref:Uncharacterized protein n=1 Tax=Ficus carica TaxID=3494 RepID=A0AA87Z326_FICCA|nr:hypothetical protein TIFTF001_002258 [Ficus carica]